VLQSGTLNVSAFATEDNLDFLTVGTTRFSGNKGPAQVFVESSAQILWRSDGPVQQTGWKICLEPSSKKEACAYNDLTASGSLPGGVNVSGVNCSTNSAVQNGESCQLQKEGFSCSSAVCNQQSAFPVPSAPTPGENLTLQKTNSAPLH
jgi:hypothetical protein